MCGPDPQCALCDYKIKCGDQKPKIPVDAAIGMVQWNGWESAAELMERADRAAYASTRTLRFRCVDFLKTPDANRIPLP